MVKTSLMLQIKSLASRYREKEWRRKDRKKESKGLTKGEGLTINSRLEVMAKGLIIRMERKDRMVREKIKDRAKTEEAERIKRIINREGKVKSLKDKLINDLQSLKNQFFKKRVLRLKSKAQSQASLLQNLLD
jgi:hypothetical protein